MKFVDPLASVTAGFNCLRYKDHTCELSCSDDNLKVVTILRANNLASAKPKEKSEISAMSP